MQELLGEGTFAKVFKAALRQEKPPSPVSGRAINNNSVELQLTLGMGN